MAKNEIKTETTAEQYMTEVIGPRIEAIEETIDSLREDQTTVLNTVKESNAALATKFEEMQTAKVQGPQRKYFNQEFVDTAIKNSIGKLLDDNLIQRKIKVETTATAHIAADDLTLLRAQANAFKEWTSSNLKSQAAYDKSRRPFIRINFTKKWLRATAIVLFMFTLFAIGYVHYGVHQTPQSWANRSYEAGLELDEENPGAAYHEIIQAFENGYAAEARQKVSDREIAGKERTKKKRKYEKMLNKYLSDVDSVGVTVTDYMEDVDGNGGVESLVFFHWNDSPIHSFKAHIEADCAVAITSDKRVISIGTARKYYKYEIWIFCGKITTPFKVNE